MPEAETTKHETVLDTGAEQLGKTYAQALIGAAQDAGVTDKVIGQLGQIVDQYIAGSPQLAAVLASPRIDPEEKVRVIDRVFSGDFDPTLIKFLKVMANRGRLGFVGAVRLAAEGIYDEQMGRAVATVRTAVPMTDALRGDISAKLGSVLKREVRLKEEVDPDLIGGMVVRVGDTVFDDSVANRLDKIGRKAREGFSSRLAEKIDSLIPE